MAATAPAASATAPVSVSTSTTASAAATVATMSTTTVSTVRGGLRVDWFVEAQVPRAVAVVTFLGEGLREACTDLLAGQLHQPQAGDLGHLVAGAVTTQALDETSQ